MVYDNQCFLSFNNFMKKIDYLNFMDKETDLFKSIWEGDFLDLPFSKAYVFFLFIIHKSLSQGGHLQS